MTLHYPMALNGSKQQLVGLGVIPAELLPTTSDPLPRVDLEATKFCPRLHLSPPPTDLIEQLVQEGGFALIDDDAGPADGLRRHFRPVGLINADGVDVRSIRDIPVFEYGNARGRGRGDDIRTAQSSSPMAVSAVSSVRTSGVLVTVMPCAPAHLASTLS